METPPTTVTVNCLPSGTAEGTSATDYSSCTGLTPAQIAAVTVTRSATGIITVGNLPAGYVPAISSASFTLNGTTVNATVAADGTVTTNSPLGAGTWSFVLDQIFDSAPAAVITGSLIVPAAPAPACTAPSVVNSVTEVCVAPPAATGYTYNANLGGGGAFVANIGVLVTGANTLPATCLTVGDACWVSSVQNGTIKFVNSGVTIAPINNRPIVFAFYQTATGYYNTQPVYADDGAPAASTGVSGGGNTNTYLDVKGTMNGVRQTFSATVCAALTFNGVGTFISDLISCPI